MKAFGGKAESVEDEEVGAVPQPDTAAAEVTDAVAAPAEAEQVSLAGPIVLWHKHRSIINDITSVCSN